MACSFIEYYCPYIECHFIFDIIVEQRQENHEIKTNFKILTNSGYFEKICQYQ